MQDISKYKIMQEILDSTKSVELLDKNIKSIIEVYLELIIALYKAKPELRDGEVFIETLSMKMILSTRTIQETVKGLFLNTTIQSATVKYVDFSSINVLTRAIIESFLTLEYLYFANLSEEEKQFRFDVWRVSGYKARQSFFDELKNIPTDSASKLGQEKNEIQTLLTRIKDSKYYTKLSKQDIWKLDKYGIPRLRSWLNLIKESRIKNMHIEAPYKLYSSYAHSEFISLIQMNGKDTLALDNPNAQRSIRNSYHVVTVVLCVSIDMICERFSDLNSAINVIDKRTKLIIDLWKTLGVNKNGH